MKKKDLSPEQRKKKIQQLLSNGATYSIVEKEMINIYNI